MDKMLKYKLFLDFLDFEFDITHYTLDKECNILSVSNDKNRTFYKKMLEHIFPTVKEIFSNREDNHPIIISNSMLLSWSFIFDNDDDNKIYMMGPVFMDNVSVTDLSSKFKYYRITTDEETSALERMKDIPVLNFVLLTRHTLRIHFAINDEKLYENNISYHTCKISEDEEEFVKKNDDLVILDRRRTWMAEQQLLKIVRDGNLNYKGAIDRAARFSNGLKIHTPGRS